MRHSLVLGLAVVAAVAGGCGHPSPPPPAHPPAAASATDPMDPVYADALAGDMRAALAELARIPDRALDDQAAAQRTCLRTRFVDKQPSAVVTRDPLVTDVIAVFRDYWTRVLVQELTPAAGADYLFDRLGRAVAAATGDAAPAPTLDAMLDRVGTLLEARGYHSIRGVTAPYYELMAWGTQTAKAYDVELPETTIAVTVVFMDDFVSRGWAEFATCGRSSAGGWAGDDSLYCVADSYDPASETFRVSYLAHESQHFADYKQFPKLEQPELEYRAKLVELIQSRTTTLDLIAGFAAQTAASRDAPHGLANAHVVADISRAVFGGDAAVAPGRWRTARPEAIQAAAASVLRDSTARLQALGAATVERAFD